MDVEQIRQRKKEIEERYGKWTQHDVHLGNDLYTLRWGPNTRARRIVQLVADMADRPLQQLRILDLACSEGQFAIEFALHGAQVVGIEGREAVIERARFAKDVLSLNNLELVQDDVRQVNEAKYGVFDVVLCLGILYHLDAPDVFHFTKQVREVCRRLAVIDTHISLKDDMSRSWVGRTYWGAQWEEHCPGTTPEDKLKAVWESLDNENSFVFTRSSLYNLLSHVGFTSVCECHVPFERVWKDRVTLAAICGQRQTVISHPPTSQAPDAEWPEKPEQHVFVWPPPGYQFPGGRVVPGPPEPARPKLVGRLARLLPRPVKGFLKKFRR